MSTVREPGAGAGLAAAELTATVRIAQILGLDNLTDPDPTEDFHEASRLYPGLADPLLLGAARLERSPELRVTASRSVRRHSHRPALALPPAQLGEVTLAEAIAGRRSCHDFGDAPLELEDVATLLRSAYGTTGRLGPSQALRAVPSGGALYPLEVYAVCRHVEGAEAAVYHYDPLRHALERLRPLVDPAEVDALTPFEELVAASAIVIVVTAVFWRSRFKYGARAYRFALLEAGHLAQNLLLAAVARNLAALPVGGFFDRRADELVGADGLYEAALYLVPVGSRRS